MRAWFAAFLFLAGAASAEDYSNLTASTRSVDATSRESLGINIRAISLLLQASPRAFVPIWALEKKGDLDVLKDLAAKGFVTLTQRRGLPDGSDSDTVYMNYIATEKGNAIVSAIMGS